MKLNHFILLQVFKNVDVENALKQNIEANLTIHTLADSNWGTSISKADFTNYLRIQLNPPEKLDNIHGVLQFTAYVGGFVRVVPITSLLQASEQFGNISFTRPTLYIFPGCQGDSALFGVNGFNFLVNGGYNRRACFWDFARHLDRIDAMLLTHLGTDNIFGLSTVLQRKNLENIHPQIGYLYFNAIEKTGALPPLEGGDGSSGKSPTLLVNLAEEANKVTQMAKQLSISPHPCSRSASAANLEPVNLYHKLGHGSLDMYILNPVADSKELKDFYQLWSKQAANLDANGPFPLPNTLSVCALLVWKPYNFDEKIVRILFPGNAPQHRVIEGFEKMKSFGFLKLPSCTTRDLMKPPPVKRPQTGSNKLASSGGRGSAKASASARSEAGKALNARVESPRKETRPTSAKSEAKTSSPTKPVKSIKEDNSKKNGKTKEKPKAVEKETRPKSASAKDDEKETKVKKDVKPSASSPTKAPSTSHKAPSPTKASSPTKSPSPPKASSPAKLSPTKAKAPAAVKVEESKSVVAAAPADQTGSDAPAVSHSEERDLKPESEQGQLTQQNGAEALQTLDDDISEARDAVGAVDDMSVSISSAFDRQKLEELGIYEEQSPKYGKQKAEYANEKDSYEFEEEEKPQALPEPPIIIESPSQESDIMPDYSSKIESYEQELSEFSRAEEELRKLESDTYDPAQEIPESPESCKEEQQNYRYSSSVEPLQSFETPVFSNEGPDTTANAGHLPVEQNIQYGIGDSLNERDMGGIQEVDEEEHEDDGSVTGGSDIRSGNLDHNQIYDKEEDESANGFEKDSNPDEEEIKKVGSYQDQEVEKNLTRDSRASHERQDEGVDEGIEDEDSSVPAAFDKDSSPEADASSDAEQNVAENNDKDLHESGLPRVNGDEVKSADKADPVLESKTAAASPFYGVVGEGNMQKQGFGDESDEEQPASFDPLSQWGQPMGLPSPPSADEGRRGAKTANDGKKRPATAPPSAGRGAVRPGSATKRSGTGSRSSPLDVKTPPLPPMTPFYVDLTYIPNHGDAGYSDVEFFKRIRARNYVISALSPNPQVLDYLLEAKESWEQKDLEVTIIPTYESDILRHWMGLNKERLQELHIDMTPPVCRCTIKLQDLETSLPAYRLEV